MDVYLNMLAAWLLAGLLAILAISRVIAFGARADAHLESPRPARRRRPNLRLAPAFAVIALALLGLGEGAIAPDTAQLPVKNLTADASLVAPPPSVERTARPHRGERPRSRPASRRVTPLAVLVAAAPRVPVRRTQARPARRLARSTQRRAALLRTAQPTAAPATVAVATVASAHRAPQVKARSKASAQSKAQAPAPAARKVKAKSGHRAPPPHAQAKGGRKK